MRTALDEFDVVCSAAALPSPGETSGVPLGRSGPRGRGERAELPAFGSDPRLASGVPVRLRRRIDRFSALAYLAVSEVLAALPPGERPPRERIGLFLANTRAGWSYGEPELGLLVDEGPAAMHAYQATAWFPAAAQGEVTIELDLRGCAKTTAGRTSGLGEALWLARDALERDAVDLAIAGAAESLVNGFVLRDWPEDEPLPTHGSAEGAVVLALRRPGAGGSVRLRDLRFADVPADTTDRDWVPTLSRASRLHEAVRDSAGAGAVPLGGGYWITVEHPESPSQKEKS
jgi:hypothetical protein